MTGIHAFVMQMETWRAELTNIARQALEPCSQLEPADGVSRGSSRRSLRAERLDPNQRRSSERDEPDVAPGAPLCRGRLRAPVWRPRPYQMDRRPAATTPPPGSRNRRHPPRPRPTSRSRSPERFELVGRLLQRLGLVLEPEQNPIAKIGDLPRKLAHDVAPQAVLVDQHLIRVVTSVVQSSHQPVESLQPTTTRRWRVRNRSYGDRSSSSVVLIRPIGPEGERPDPDVGAPLRDESELFAVDELGLAVGGVEQRGKVLTSLDVLDRLGDHLQTSSAQRQLVDDAGDGAAQPCALLDRAALVGEDQAERGERGDSPGDQLAAGGRPRTRVAPSAVSASSRSCGMSTSSRTRQPSSPPTPGAGTRW